MSLAPPVPLGKRVWVLQAKTPPLPAQVPVGTTGHWGAVHPLRQDHETGPHHRHQHHTDRQDSQPGPDGVARRLDDEVLEVNLGKQNAPVNVAGQSKQNGRPDGINDELIR